MWLNEGFATFVGWLATDHIFPEWKVWTSFVCDDFAQGLGLDGMRSSHPIDIEVNNPNEINQIFDAISYSKGASLIRMLTSYLGEENFASGVSCYLKKHAYGNAKTTDLWDALQKASGKDVGTLMNNWTKKVGYPMVTVDSESYDAKNKQLTINISQKRFLSSGDLKIEEDSTVWLIPIQISTHLNDTKPISFLLDTKRGSVSFPYEESPDSFYKLNFSTTGFYRVCYSAAHLDKLGKAILRDNSKFTAEDRIGILNDAFAFARAGYGSTTGALNLAKGFVEEENYMVLDELNTRLNLVCNAWFKENTVTSAVKTLMKTIFSSKVKELGYDYPYNENFLISQKRTLSIGAAAIAEDKRYIIFPRF